MNFSIENVFPSWFVVFAGIAVGSVTAPAFNLAGAGKVLFWFGIMSYIILLPIIIYRVFIIKKIPEQALPTIAIFPAPVSLCLTGYMNSFQEKNMVIISCLVAVSQFTLLWLLLQLPRLLKLSFYPSYSALTFPFVITAISLKSVNSFLENAGEYIAFLPYLINLEELLAIVMVLYVLVRYIGFLFITTEAAKK